MARIFGLNGLAGSGKDYTAQAVKTHSKKTVDCFAYADPLKQACKHLFNLNDFQVMTQEGKKQITDWHWEDVFTNIRGNRSGRMTVREILQTFGTEMMRDRWNAEHWTNLMFNRIKNSTADVIFITDVRFANEARIVRELGGQVIQVFGRKAADVANHTSENQSIVIDHTFFNVGDNTPKHQYEAFNFIFKIDTETEI